MTAVSAVTKFYRKEWQVLTYARMTGVTVPLAVLETPQVPVSYTHLTLPTICSV